MKKKLLSMLLSIGIISSMTALPVFAAETPTQAEEDVSIETYASEPTPEWAAANGWTYDARDYSYYKTINNVTYHLYLGWNAYIQYEYRGLTGKFAPEELFGDLYWQICIDDSPNASGVIDIPSSIDGYPVECIDPDAFRYNTNITELILHDNMETIGAEAFYHCSNLAKVTFPNNTLLLIDGGAFSECASLKELTLPASLRDIGKSALDRNHFTNLTFKGSAPQIMQTNDIVGYTLDLEDDVVINVYSNTVGWDADNWKGLNINVIQNGNPIETTAVKVNPTSISLKKGNTAAVTVTVEPSNAANKNITWSSADSSIAAANNKGIIKGISKGKTTVTATCGKVSATIAVTVTDDSADNSTSLPYTDVHKGDWFYDTVADVYQRKLMTGLDTTTFGPAQTLARAQFATILYRMENEPEVTFREVFPDVTEGQFYTSPVIWANANGIVTGYSDTGMFGPADKINREQMAVMMFRYANYKGLNTSQRADLSEFPDSGSVDDFAEEAMSWCVANGIITGDNGKLNPHGDTARAVCATIISRFVNAYNL